MQSSVAPLPLMLQTMALGPFPATNFATSGSNNACAHTLMQVFLKLLIFYSDTVQAFGEMERLLLSRRQQASASEQRHPLVMHRPFSTSLEMSGGCSTSTAIATQVGEMRPSEGT